MPLLCSGPHNTSLSNAVKKVAVLKCHPHDVVACDENGHVSNHFQSDLISPSQNRWDQQLQGQRFSFFFLTLRFHDLW